MKFRNLLALLVLLFGSATRCHGQGEDPSINGPNLAPRGGGYTISGSVRDDVTGQALNGIRVDLKKEGIAVESAYTGNNGGFQFNSIPNGEYILEVNVDGYETADQDVDISRQPVYGVSIDLKKPVSLSPAESKGAAISAHELMIPSKARDAYDEGVGLLRSNPADYKAAIVQFQRAIQIFPGYYEAYCVEGASYMSLGDAPSAEQAARKSIELSSGKYPQALFLLAAILNKGGRFAEAETEARQAVALDDSAWQGHFELAHALSGLNRPQEAEPEAIRARDLNSANPRAFLLLANIHGQLQNSAAVLEDLDGYLKIAPPGPQTDAVRQSRDQLQKSIPDAQARPTLQPAKPQP
ncbi:MAG: carboxypeptidase regulatory-like domain-containing protein [Candidatus Acidiferrales bacterium]